MKAKLKPRIDLANRTRLETVIPLQTPFIIFIDPSDTCNFQCQFCPTGDRELMRKTPGRGHGPMDWDLYRKLIDDLADFPDPVKVIRLYKDGEPLLNPRFADMVRYAKDSGHCLRVDTTTNASLLTHERSDRMIDAGLDRINISVEGMDSEYYKKFSGITLDFNKYVDEIAYLYEHRKQCEMIVKINGDMLTEEARARFLQTFGEIADGVSIESVMSCWHDFDMKGGLQANQNVGVYGQPLSSVDVCPYMFYQMAINSDGTASACFLDWKRDMLIGDAKEQSLYELWNSLERYDYLRMFLEHRRGEHAVCKICGQLTHGMPDNIDAYAEELLEKLKESRNTGL